MKKIYISACTFFLMQIQILCAFAEDFTLTKEKNNSIYNIFDWSNGTIELSTGNSFSTFCSVENFYNKSKIISYSLKIKETDDECINYINVEMDDGKILKKTNILYEKTEIFFEYDKQGRVTASNTLKITYDDDLKRVSCDSQDLYNYELKFANDGYEYIKQNLQEPYSKKDNRKFIYKNNYLMEVKDLKIFQNGKCQEGLRYTIDYDSSQRPVKYKTFNKDGNLRTEENIIYEDSTITVTKDIHEYNGASHETWKFSDFDNFNNWSKASLIRNGKLEKTIERKIVYSS